MSAHAIKLSILVGIAAGLQSGLASVGDGVIIVPCLILLLGFTQKEA